MTAIPTATWTATTSGLQGPAPSQAGIRPKASEIGLLMRKITM